MKRGVIFTVILLLNFLAINAQVKSSFADIQWGSSQKVKKGLTMRNVVGDDEENIYILNSNRPLYSIDGTISFVSSRDELVKYNKDLQFKKAELIEPEIDGNKSDYEDLFQFGGKLVLLSSYRSPDTDNRVLAAQTIDKETLLPEKSYKKLSEIDSKKFSWKIGFFNYTLSRDSSKLFVYYKKPQKNNENDAFGMHVYDTDLNELWHEEIELPYTEKMFYVKDLIVDNEGNAHVLGVLFEEEGLLGGVKTKKNGKANYHYRILSFYQRGKVIENYKIEVGDHFLNDLQIMVDNQMNIICSGFYSNKESRNIKGVYYSRINSKTKKTDIETFEDFSTELLSKEATDRKKDALEKKDKKGKDEELEDFDIDKVILKEDGGLVLFAEKFFTRTHTSSNGNGGYTTRTSYHFDDILAISLDSQGKVLWSNLIEKSQSGLFYSSYNVAIVEDRTYVLYNEHEKNLNRIKDDPYVSFFGWKSWNATLTEIDSKGNMKGEVLFNCNDIGVINVPIVSSQISSNEMIIFNFRRSMSSLAKLTFKTRKKDSKGNLVY
ncbi:hypothetical protein [Marinigracilibium pacificum]|uniref:Uncharacterized protein n=1 Tax=Marinigracilibium pacificum TaxID=2729599 RepID=A0A848IZF3_9BACT|nr:hypothetical protein [Marinigracilibium pacificum]NMM48528.1 hypothetical protein [Marinigracilibium pacificum]